MIPHIPLHMANLLLRRCQCDLPSLYFTYLVNFLPSAPLQTNFYHNVQDTYYLLLAQRVGKKKKKARCRLPHYSAAPRATKMECVSSPGHLLDGRCKVVRSQPLCRQANWKLWT